MAVRSLSVPLANDPRTAALISRALPPLDVIEHLGAHAQVVFLAERHGVQQFLNFVIDNIAEFAAMGFGAVAMEFGAAEAQAELDSIVVAPIYREHRVRELMFDYNVGWPLREYQDVAHAVWDYNRKRLDGLPPFRLVNLSYRYNWSGWDGQRTPTSLRSVQYLGPVDVFRANVIEHVAFKHHTKMLALMGEPHALRSNVWPEQPPAVAGFVTPDRSWTAQVVEDRHPGRVRSVWLHSPVESEGGMVLPCDGVLDAIAVSEGPYGLLTPFDSGAGDLQLGSRFLPGVTLAETVDAVISLAPVRDLRSCAIDPQFATEANWPRVLTEWPDIDWHPRPTNLAEYYNTRTAAFEIPEVWGIDRA